MMAKSSGEQRRTSLLEWDDTKGTPKTKTARRRPTNGVLSALGGGDVKTVQLETETGTLTLRDLQGLNVMTSDWKTLPIRFSQFT